MSNKALERVRESRLSAVGRHRPHESEGVQGIGNTQLQDSVTYAFIYVLIRRNAKCSGLRVLLVLQALTVNGCNINKSDSGKIKIINKMRRKA